MSERCREDAAREIAGQAMWRADRHRAIAAVGLPEPTTVDESGAAVWRLGGYLRTVRAGLGHRVALLSNMNVLTGYTPAQCRELAGALLAAADYLEAR